MHNKTKTKLLLVALMLLSLGWPQLSWSTAYPPTAGQTAARVLQDVTNKLEQEFVAARKGQYGIKYCEDSRRVRSHCVAASSQSGVQKCGVDTYKRYEKEIVRIEAEEGLSAKAKADLKKAAQNELEQELERIEKMP